MGLQITLIGIVMVMKFDDFDEYQSEAKVKEAGKLKTEGKDYTVCDGDIIHFRFNN